MLNIKKPKLIRATLLLTQEQIDFLTGIANEKKVSFSWAVRFAIDTCIDAWKAKMEAKRINE